MTRTRSLYRIIPLTIDVSDIEMVSLDELRNKLPQGFSS